MSQQMKETVDETLRGAETEYVVVREEILARVRMRQQLIAITLALGGAFLGVGLKYPAVALIYPPIAAFLGIAWAQNDYRVRDLANYIRKYLEPHIPAVNWESYIASKRSGRGVSSWRFVVLSHGGLLLFTQALATYVGVVGFVSNLQTQPKPVATLAVTLLVLDVIAISAVIWLVRQAIR